jgi:hypothetical protein
MLWSVKQESHVPMPWGNVDTDVFAAWGQWVGGIGSLLAVVALVIITGLDASRRRRETRDTQAAQARTVTAAVERRQNDDRSALWFGKWSVVDVGNHGTRPILDVAVESIELRLDGACYSDWYVSTRDEQRGAQTLARVIGPGTSASLGALRFDGLADNVQLTEDLDYTITFSFVDAEGLRWRRSGHTLRRILGHR